MYAGELRGDGEHFCRLGARDQAVRPVGPVDIAVDDAQRIRREDRAVRSVGEGIGGDKGIERFPGFYQDELIYRTAS